MDLKHPDLYWPEHSKENWLSGKFSWNEVGIIYKLLEKYNCSLLIETDTGKGELLPWMELKTTHNNCFHYLGISLDNTMLLKDVPRLELIPNLSLFSGSCFSDAIKNMIQSRLDRTKEASMIFCNNNQSERAFKVYANIARPGDVICAWGFPINFHLSVFDELHKSGKIKRIKENWTWDRLIAGVII